MAIRKMNEDSDGKPTIGMRVVSKSTPVKKRKSLGQKVLETLATDPATEYEKYKKNQTPNKGVIKKKRY